MKVEGRKKKKKLNMDSAIIYQTSSLTINEPEIKEFTWDFEISPRSKIQKNIEAVSFGGFSFNNLQFTTEFLAELDHRWSINFFSNQINTNITIPARDLTHRYTIQDSLLQFISENQLKSTQVLKFMIDEENYHHEVPLRKTWTSIWTNKDGCWDDSVDRIRIVFKISRETSGQIQPSGSIVQLHPCPDAAAIDASKFFMDPFSSDITLHCKGQDFSCHRFLLIARASKFYDMVSQLIFEQFGEDKLTETPKRVVIRDMEPEILKELLHFIYCGSVMASSRSDYAQLELLKVAAKFGLKALQILCEKEIWRKVTVENCLIMLDIAINGLDGEMELLKERAIQVIAMNRQVVLKDRETFKNFIRDYGDIAFEIMEVY